MKKNKTKKKFDARTIEGRLHLKRSDASRRAWVTIRANREGKGVVNRIRQ
jgi:hypothetical protein